MDVVVESIEEAVLCADRSGDGPGGRVGAGSAPQAVDDVLMPAPAMRGTAPNRELVDDERGQDVQDGDVVQEVEGGEEGAGEQRPGERHVSVRDYVPAVPDRDSEQRYQRPPERVEMQLVVRVPVPGLGGVVRRDAKGVDALLEGPGHHAVERDVPDHSEGVEQAKQQPSDGDQRWRDDG